MSVDTDHFGYHRSVFINCPYDAQYSPMFEAIVFAIMACGFRAVTARSRLNSAEKAASRRFSRKSEGRAVETRAEGGEKPAERAAGYFIMFLNLLSTSLPTRLSAAFSTR